MILETWADKSGTYKIVLEAVEGHESVIRGCTYIATWSVNGNMTSIQHRNSLPGIMQNINFDINLAEHDDHIEYILQPKE